ncbi:MAG: hypothetical protein AAFN93_28915 [Bacteroidota bacterium]
MIAVLDFEGGRSQLQDVVPGLESLNFQRMEFIDGLEGFLIDFNGNMRHSDGGILANDMLRFTTRGPNKPAQLRDMDRLREFFSNYLDNNYKGDWRKDFNANNYVDQ